MRRAHLLLRRNALTAAGAPPCDSDIGQVVTKTQSDKMSMLLLDL